MNKKLYVYLSLVALLAIIGVVIWLVIGAQNNKYTNFVDPKLTNQELANIEGKIIELEQSIESRREGARSGDQDKLNDFYKLNMELGSYYRLRGRLLDAKKIVTEATKLLPDNPSTYNELYVIESAMGNYEGAKKALLKSIELNPVNAQVWRWYIDLATNSLGYTDAQVVDLYTQALEKTAGNVDIVTYYALYLENHNDLLGAVGQWKKAAELNPAGQAQYQAEIERIQNKLK